MNSNEDKKLGNILGEDDEFEYISADGEEFDDDEYELVYMDENGNIIEINEDNKDKYQIVSDEEVKKTDISSTESDTILPQNELREENADKTIELDLMEFDVISNGLTDIDKYNRKNDNTIKLDLKEYDDISNNVNYMLGSNSGNGLPGTLPQTRYPVSPQNKSKLPYKQSYDEAYNNSSRTRRNSKDLGFSIFLYTTIGLITVLIIVIIYLVIENGKQNPDDDGNLIFQQEDAMSVGDKDELNNSDDSEDSQNNTNTDSEIDDNKNNTDNNDDNQESNNTLQFNSSEDITMIFGGDVLLSDATINAYNKNGNGIYNIMGETLVNEFHYADLAMINQEFPFSTRGEKMKDKQYTFRVNPQYVSIFKELSFDIVSLANNHILDFGTDALLDSLQTLDDAGIMRSGAGYDSKDARKINYVDIKGKTISVLSASRVIPVTEWNATTTRPGVFTAYDTNNLVNDIKEAEDNSDFTVVFLHWGIERNTMPEDYQRDNAKKYIDAGADIVIGCHPHVLQGVEYYNGVPIVYSLGNFMFNSNTDKTMALKVIIDKDNNTKIQILPCTTKSYCTYILTEQNDVNSYFEYYNSLSFDVKFGNDGYLLQ